MTTSFKLTGRFLFKRNIFGQQVLRVQGVGRTMDFNDFSESPPRMMWRTATQDDADRLTAMHSNCFYK